jgi:hypothetical protein
MSTEPLPWLRLYTEFCVDPSIQMLAFEDQRHYVMVLCMKGRGMLDKAYPNADLRNRTIAMTLGLDLMACGDAHRRLREHGLVDEHWHPIAWERRQFKSDHDAADRQRRSRERRAKVRHVTVTTTSRDMSRDSHSLDTDTEADTDSEREARARGNFSVSRGTGDDAASLEAWREDKTCNPEAMQLWLLHLSMLDPPKSLSGIARITAAKTIASFGDYNQQLRVIEHNVGNGFRNLRISDGMRENDVGEDVAAHIARLRKGTA